MTKTNALSKKYELKYPKMGTRRLSSNWQSIKCRLNGSQPLGTVPKGY